MTCKEKAKAIIDGLAVTEGFSDIKKEWGVNQICDLCEQVARKAAIYVMYNYRDEDNLEAFINFAIQHAISEDK